MTTLEKPVSRKLPIKLEGDDYVVEIHPRYLRIRRARSRKEDYSLDWETILDRARKNSLSPELVAVTKARSKGRR